MTAFAEPHRTFPQLCHPVPPQLCHPVPPPLCHPERSSAPLRRTQSKDPETARLTPTLEPFSTTNRLRVVTYNIHKCRGLDRRTSPSRILAVLHELSADILCLQEVVNAPAASLSARGQQLYDQAGEIARAFPAFASVFASNRPLHGGDYGNLTLSRFPIAASLNHDLTHRREPRGALQTDIALPTGLTLHVFNIHLGTGFAERRHQARRLLSETILAAPTLHPPRLVLGDFNEWTRGLATRLLRSTFQTFPPQHAARFPRTFPGLLPLLTLDHCYYEPPLHLDATHLHRTRTALLASDHLPLIADFHLTPKS